MCLSTLRVNFNHCLWLEKLHLWRNTLVNPAGGHHGRDLKSELCARRNNHVPKDSHPFIVVFATFLDEPLVHRDSILPVPLTLHEGRQRLERHILPDKSSNMGKTWE